MDDDTDRALALLRWKHALLQEDHDRLRGENQELMRENARLTSEDTYLEKEIDRLRARIAELKKALRQIKQDACRTPHCEMCGGSEWVIEAARAALDPPKDVVIKDCIFDPPLPLKEPEK